MVHDNCANLEKPNESAIERIFLYTRSTTFHPLYKTVSLPWWYTGSSIGFAIVGTMSYMCNPRDHCNMFLLGISVTSYTADVVYIGVGGYNNIIDTLFVVSVICVLGYHHIPISPICLPISFLWPYYHFVKGQRIYTVSVDKLKHHALWHWSAQILIVYMMQPINLLNTSLFMGSILACELSFETRPAVFAYVWASAIALRCVQHVVPDDEPIYSWISYIS